MPGQIFRRRLEGRPRHDSLRDDCSSEGDGSDAGRLERDLSLVERRDFPGRRRHVPFHPGWAFGGKTSFTSEPTLGSAHVDLSASFVAIATIQGMSYRELTAKGAGATTRMARRRLLRSA
jgi:hypothetical protein